MCALEVIEINTSQMPDASVIWLHGLGASGHDFIPVIPELGLPETLAARFLFPNAPSIPVTANMGYAMPAWYDIIELAPEPRIDREQFDSSCRAVGNIIDAEIRRGIAPGRIVLAGFSQGGSIAYEVFLKFPNALAGLIAMSTFMVDQPPPAPGGNENPPIRIMHGGGDPMVPVEMGRRAARNLQRRGYEATLTEYAMGHEVCPEQIRDIGQCLREWLS